MPSMPRACRWRTCCSKASSTAFGALRRSGACWARSCISTPGFSGSRRPTRWSRWTSATLRDDRPLAVGVAPHPTPACTLMRSLTLSLTCARYGVGPDGGTAMKSSWHTAWQGMDIAVYRNDAEVDRLHAPDIERVVLVHHGSGDSPGDLVQAVVELGDSYLIFPADTGFAGRVNFERQA